ACPASWQPGRTAWLDPGGSGATAMPGRRRNRSLAAKTVWGAPAWRPPHRQCDPYPQDQLSSSFDKLRRRRTAISAIPADNSPPLRISRPPRLIPVAGRSGSFGSSPGAGVVGSSLAGGLGSPLAGGVGSPLGDGPGSWLAGGSPGQVWLRLNCGLTPSVPAGAVTDPSTSVPPAGVTSHRWSAPPVCAK